MLGETLDYDTMKEMAGANCRLLIVGYESGSDVVLKRIKKGVTFGQMKKFADNAKRAGLLRPWRLYHWLTW